MREKAIFVMEVNFCKLRIDHFLINLFDIGFCIYANIPQIWAPESSYLFLTNSFLLTPPPSFFLLFSLHIPQFFSNPYLLKEYRIDIGMIIISIMYQVNGCVRVYNMYIAYYRCPENVAIYPMPYGRIVFSIRNFEIRYQPHFIRSIYCINIILMINRLIVNISLKLFIKLYSSMLYE